MKKIFLFLSMLLAMGLSSACSSDEENPFVGEWQLVEARYVDSGEIAYPPDKDDGLHFVNTIKFMSNLECKSSGRITTIEEWPSMMYSYDGDVLTVKYVDSELYYSYKYEFLEKGILLKLTDYKSNKNPGIYPRQRLICTLIKIK